MRRSVKVQGQVRESAKVQRQIEKVYEGAGAKVEKVRRCNGKMRRK